MLARVHSGEPPTEAKTGIEWDIPPIKHRCDARCRPRNLPSRKIFTTRSATLGAAMKQKILVPAIGLILVWHVLFALSLANQRCLDDMLPAPACRTTASLWVNPLTDAATLTVPKLASLGGEDKGLADGFRMGFDFAASAVAEKKLNDSARKHFDLYAMALPYRVIVEEKASGERPLPFSLSVTKAESVQADPQGHVMLFAQAHSQDGKNFVLVCHTAQPTCFQMRPGDYTFTVLHPGDPYYAYDYTKESDAVVVRANVHREPDRAELVAVFTMSKRQRSAYETRAVAPEPRTPEPLHGQLRLTVDESLDGPREITLWPNQRGSVFMSNGYIVSSNPNNPTYQRMDLLCVVHQPNCYALIPGMTYGADIVQPSEADYVNTVPRSLSGMYGCIKIYGPDHVYLYAVGTNEIVGMPTVDELKRGDVQ